MSKFARRFTMFFIALLIVAGFYSERPRAQVVDLKLKGESLSAHLNGTPLKHVFEKLNREKGIWFKGDASLFEEKISVHFSDLSLQDGLKRILSSMNYSLVFGDNGRLDGVIIIGKSALALARAESTGTASKKNVLSPSPKDHKTNSSPGSFVEVTKEELENLKVIKNAPTPGGPVEVTAEDHENMKVIKNAPTPGGPIHVTAEELENLKVIKNCPPPGGPIQVTAEELENMKGNNNWQPPGS